jgi:hypothetical protein
MRFSVEVRSFAALCDARLDYRAAFKAALSVPEVKTGDDPPFSDPQRAYYPLLQIGNHIYSDDVRILTLGLVPGRPFPPMMVHLIYTPGPGKPYEVAPLPPPTFVP